MTGDNSNGKEKIGAVLVVGAGIGGMQASLDPVSYTHLTLPTIYSV